MAFGAAGDPVFARYEGEVTAREARAVGVQWVFFPVADVNNNPDNPVINMRSFGENPEAVASMVRPSSKAPTPTRRITCSPPPSIFPGMAIRPWTRI